MNREQLLGHICNRLSNISESVVILTELLEKFIDTPETVKEIQPESSILSTPALSIKKEKKVKDPNAPKAPLTSYLLFSNEKRTQLTTDNPEAKFAELAKLMGASWQALPKEQKKVFEVQAAKLKELHVKEVKVYQDEVKKQTQVQKVQVEESDAPDTDMGSESDEVDAELNVAAVEEEEEEEEAKDESVSTTDSSSEESESEIEVPVKVAPVPISKKTPAPVMKKSDTPVTKKSKKTII